MKNIILNNKDLKIFKKNFFFINSFYFFKNNYRNENFLKKKISKKDLKKIYKNITALHNYLSNFLSIKLNKIHSENNSKTYWGILIDSWLMYYIQIFYHKWIEVEKLMQCNFKSKINLYYNSKLNPPINFDNFFYLMSNENQNSILYSEIIKRKKKISINKNIKIQIKFENLNKNFTQPLPLILKILSFLNFKKKIVFIDTYFSIKKIFLSFIKIGILPNFVDCHDQTYNFKNRQVWSDVRNTMCKDIKIKSNFESFLIDNIKNYFPLSYLENYKKIKKKTQKEFNYNPNFIVSSVNHIHNDFKKFWIAESIKKKTKFVTMQHGGGMGSSLFNSGEYLDIKNSNKYLSWGWKDNAKVLPNFMTLKRSNNRSGKKILLVLYGFPKYANKILPNLDQDPNITFFKRQMCFLKKIDKNIYKELIVRVPQFLHLKKFYKDEIKKISREINFDENEALKDSIQSARMLITTFNSTVFLEGISSGCPTLGIWEKDTSLLRNSVIKDYKILKENHIIFDKFDKAANLINKEFKNIEKWWLNNKRFKITQSFIKKFCNTSEKVNPKVKKIFIN